MYRVKGDQIALLKEYEMSGEKLKDMKQGLLTNNSLLFHGFHFSVSKRTFSSSIPPIYNIYSQELEPTPCTPKVDKH